MDFLKLDELMKISKKGDASKEKKEEFANSIILLFSEEGYTAKTEKYFLDGFSFCGALPAFDFIKDMSNSDILDFINKITKGDLYIKNDRGISLKVLVHFLGLFTTYCPQSTDVIKLLIRYIPFRAKTKSKQINKDFPSILEKYFVSEIKKDTVLPNFQGLVHKNESAIEFKTIITDALKEINSKNEDIKLGVSKALAWVNSDIASDIDKTIPDKNDDNSPQPDNNIPKGFSAETLSQLKESLKNDLSIVSKAVFYISDLQNELSLYKKKCVDIEKAYAQLKLENEKNISEKRDLLCACNRFKEEIAIKEKMIFEMKNEIEKQKSILSVYSSDKQNSLNEQLNVIASKLKTHYLNYKDAVEMEMNIELGENIKNLMEEIFKTLIKSGINVAGKVSND